MGAIQKEIPPTQQSSKLKMSEKLAYGIGDFGANFSWTFIASFVTIYLTDTVGMAAGIIGTMMLIVRIFDGVTDIFMGSIIDKTNSKMGKAKPWVFWTAPILAVSTFLLFNVPGSLSTTGQFVYVFVVYFLISAVFYTANNVAYSSLTSFMTMDPKERVSLGSIRFIFTKISIVAISTAVPFLLVAFGEGQRGWTLTAGIFALLCAIPLMTTGLAVKERNVSKNIHDDQKAPFVQVFKLLFTNKYFLVALLTYVFLYLRLITVSAQIFYATYILNDASLMGLLSIVYTGAGVLGLLFAPKLFTIFGGLRKTITTGLLISLLGLIICAIFPENVSMLLVGLAISAIGVSILQGGLPAMVADVGDLIYWKSGVPVQGAVFSISSAGMKVGSGLASALIGWFLAFGNYVPNASTQPGSAIFAMKSLYIYLPILFTIVLLLLIGFFNLEKFMPKIRDEISTGNVGENQDMPST